MCWLHFTAHFKIIALWDQVLGNGLHPTDDKRLSQRLWLEQSFRAGITHPISVSITVYIILVDCPVLLDLNEKLILVPPPPHFRTCVFVSVYSPKTPFQG